MISMFATGDFIRVSLPAWYEFGGVGLLMGFALVPSQREEGVHHLMAIVNGQNGDVGLVATSDLKTDFIYDAEKDRFIDRSAQEPPDEMVDMGASEMFPGN